MFKHTFNQNYLYNFSADVFMSKVILHRYVCNAIREMSAIPIALTALLFDGFRTDTQRIR